MSEQSLRAAVEALCAQVVNVREYGERGTPFQNGAAQLAKRIERVLADPGTAQADPCVGCPGTVEWHAPDCTFLLSLHDAAEVARLLTGVGIEHGTAQAVKHHPKCEQVRRPTAICTCIYLGLKTVVDRADDAQADIAAAEQRGREDNERHDMCYVHGSKALAAHERQVAADAWERGAYAGRDYQKRLLEWSRIGPGPEMVPNPYRAAALRAGEPDVG